MNMGKRSIVLPMLIPNYHGENAIVFPIVFLIEKFMEKENYGMNQ